MTVGTEVGPFLTWFSNWGQVVFFFAQILFWLAIAAAAVTVASEYKRYVDYKTGADDVRAEKKAAKQAYEPVPQAAPPAPAMPEQPGGAVEIDKFIE